MLPQWPWRLLWSKKSIKCMLLCWSRMECHIRRHCAMCWESYHFGTQYPQSALSEDRRPAGGRGDHYFIGPPCSWSAYKDTVHHVGNENHAIPWDFVIKYWGIAVSALNAGHQNWRKEGRSTLLVRVLRHDHEVFVVIYNRSHAAGWLARAGPTPWGPQDIK